jgi:hypothetical protein
MAALGSIVDSDAYARIWIVMIIAGVIAITVAMPFVEIPTPTMFMNYTP